MSLLLSNKAVVFTRYMFKEAGCSLSIIFKLTALRDTTLVEGRTSGTWDAEDARGFIRVLSTGIVSNGYGGTIVVTNMETGAVVTGSALSVGIVYKITVSDIPTSSPRFLINIGCKYNGTEPLSGTVYSIKASGGHWGFGTSSAQYKGDLGYQFHEVAERLEPASKYQPLANKYPVTDRVRTGASAGYSSDWTYSAHNDTWSSNKTSAGWSRLYLIKSATQLNGQRDYESLVRFTFHATLGGKSLNLYYQAPGNVSRTHTVVEGDNDITLWLCNKDKHGDDQRPTVDGADLTGVKIKNLLVKDSHGYVLFGAEWSGEVA